MDGIDGGFGFDGSDFGSDSSDDVTSDFGFEAFDAPTEESTVSTPTAVSNPLAAETSLETTTPPTDFEGFLSATQPAPPAPAGRSAAPPGTGLTTAGTSAATQTDYAIGEPTRPDIQHDNGFLQDPTDPTNPTPIDTIAPTWDDRVYSAQQTALATAGNIATSLPFDPPGFAVPDQFEQFLDSPNGIEAYGHFLSGNGVDRSFSYDDFVADDIAGQITVGNATVDLQTGVESLYGQMVADNPALANQTVSFNVTGGAITVGATPDFPYPATDDWQKAIGGHTVWSSAEVTVTPATTPGGQPEFSMEMTLHAEDRYNFNPNQHDIETGAPDALRGRLEQVGLAHQYDHFSTFDQDVSWNGGNIATSTTIDNSGR